MSTQDSTRYLTHSSRSLITWRHLLLILIVGALVSGCVSRGDWRTASRESAGLAPDPRSTPEAVIQVYGADVWGWKGMFAIHTWISVKPTDAKEYTVYEVIGWRQRIGIPVLRIAIDQPDRHWYGAKPELLLDKRGEGVDELIAKIADAAARYPWKHEYKMFPGPNSNTFPAWIGQQVPELELDLPFSAIGSGWKPD